MTPGEMQLLRAMLREEIDEALTPVRKEVKDLAARTRTLEETDRKHSGQHRAVTRELIPQLKSNVESARLGDLAGIADAYGRIVHLVNDMSDTVARIEKRGLVEVKDETGATSIVPTALVAKKAAEGAEAAAVAGAHAALSSNRKADAIQIAADRADTHSLSAKRWAKFGPIIAIVQTILTILYHVLTSKP